VRPSPLSSAPSSSGLASHQLRIELERARALFEATADGVLVTGADGRIVSANPAFCRLFQLEERPEDLLGLELQSLCERLPTVFVDAASFSARAADVLRDQSPMLRECWPLVDGRILEADAIPVPVEGRPTERLWLWRDVTDRVRMAEGNARSHALNLSFVDELTGLSNRRGFLSQARQELDTAALVRRPMLLIFVDVDGLKQINDRLGHAAGDQALVETGAVLKSTFRERDVPARLGGDEFVVLVTDASVVGSANLLDRLEHRLQALNDRPDRQYSLAISTGVARFDPASPETLEALLSEADGQMYLEKRRKRRHG
jgi:diguanylate cyclase (GGDEF)-like protein/PAS domain S-box-containing protein